MTIVLECRDLKQGEFNREDSSLAIEGRTGRRTGKNDLTLYLSTRFILTMLKGFELIAEQEDGPLWLRLRGREGVKEFIEAEIGIK